jgi:hypothetical protein
MAEFSVALNLDLDEEDKGIRGEIWYRATKVDTCVVSCAVVRNDNGNNLMSKIDMLTAERSGGAPVGPSKPRSNKIIRIIRPIAGTLQMMSVPSMGLQFHA